MTLDPPSEITTKFNISFPFGNCLLLPIFLVSTFTLLTFALYFISFFFLNLSKKKKKQFHTYLEGKRIIYGSFVRGNHKHMEELDEEELCSCNYN